MLKKIIFASLAVFALSHGDIDSNSNNHVPRVHGARNSCDGDTSTCN